MKRLRILLVGLVACGSARAVPRAEAPPPRAPEAAPAKRIEGKCEAAPLASVARARPVVTPASFANAGAPRCRIRRNVLGPGLRNDGVHVGAGGLGVVACWAKDGDHVSVRRIDATGRLAGPVVTSGAYAYLRSCDVFVSPTTALVTVDDGRGPDERRVFGLLIDERGNLAAEALLDVAGSHGFDAWTARDDGSFVLVQGPGGSGVRPLELRWLEVSIARPRACAAKIETGLFSNGSVDLRWDDDFAPRLRAKALPEADAHQLASWYVVTADGSVTRAPAEAPARAAASAASAAPASPDAIDLVFAPTGLRRIRGAFRAGAILDIPPGLEPIDLRPYLGDAFAARSPVWTGSVYVVPLPIGDDGEAAYLTVDCAPS